MLHETHPATEGLFRGDTQKDGREDKHKYSNSVFSKFFFDFMKHVYSSVIYENSLNISLYDVY
jgi:hypothetical protein